jgi:hypothetical protein
MTTLQSLWLPILLSAVLVFIASSIIHMGPLWHRSDYPKLSKEEQLRAAVRPLDLPPGDYMIPRPSGGAEMRSAEFMEKINQGPNLMLTVLPNGPWSMARNLTQWFAYALVVSLFAAYVAGRARPPGAPYLEVFRLVGATAFIGYTLALWQMSIWYRRSWSMTIKATIDGLVYALLTAALFGWLWPR